MIVEDLRLLETRLISFYIPNHLLYEAKQQIWSRDRLQKDRHTRCTEWQRVTTNNKEWQRVIQRVTTSGTTNDNEWQRVVKRVTTNDNEWYNEWQRVTTSGTTSHKELKWVTKSDNNWPWVTASESSGTANESGIVYFKEWMIAIISITKRHTLLLQGMDGCN